MARGVPSTTKCKGRSKAGLESVSAGVNREGVGRKPTRLVWCWEKQQQHASLPSARPPATRGLLPPFPYLNKPGHLENAQSVSSAAGSKSSFIPSLHFAVTRAPASVATTCKYFQNVLKEEVSAETKNSNGRTKHRWRNTQPQHARLPPPSSAIFSFLAIPYQHPSLLLDKTIQRRPGKIVYVLPIRPRIAFAHLVRDEHHRILRGA